MIKKIVTIGLLASSLSAFAQEAPSRSYFEIGYGVLDSSSSPNLWHIDANHAFSEHWTFGGEFFNLSNNGFDLNHFELNFGYVNDISANTDFFTRIHVGQEDRKFLDSAVYGLALGTRSSLGERFELHTELKYNEIEKASNGYFFAELKGVYKFNEQSGLALAVQSWDGDDAGFELSYRHSF
ncbi:hypothetical protein [Marinicella rhabdoformis]|uniref:hypothetical protein n=1 Tax=Marinicella rhabdoformis TaxID=2580566 RepID=UPI0012AEDB9C|nr:hypothetical protein [Marinicella rhabdoformis]